MIQVVAVLYERHVVAKGNKWWLYCTRDMWWPRSDTSGGCTVRETCGGQEVIQVVAVLYERHVVAKK